MLTRDTAINSANNFIAELKEIGYNPTMAYVFGSSINGTAHEYSDIDLAVWDEKFTGALHLDYEMLKHFLLKHQHIELHSYRAEDTEDTKPFISEIKKTGFKYRLKINIIFSKQPVQRSL